VALGVAILVSMTLNWHAFGHFVATVTDPALTGVQAAITLTMGLGGFTTLRRGHHLTAGPERDMPLTWWAILGSNQ
jgi:hypothetical protein